jgi:hypothetical protein
MTQRSIAPVQSLYEDEDLRVCGVGPLFARERPRARPAPGGPTNGSLVVSFTGIGAGSDVVQTEEFAGTAARGGRSVLFVTDKRRSWYNAPGLYEKIVGQLRPHLAHGGPVVTLGNSMGGFGALLFAAPLGARTALAFGPQASVSPRIIPQETRWRELTAAIGDFRFEQISDHLGEAAEHFVLHGSGGKDAYQIEAFRPRANLHHYVLAGGRHNIAAELKQAGRLSPLIEAAVAGDRPGFDALARAAGACPREEAGPVIEHLMARRAARRAARS